MPLYPGYVSFPDNNIEGKLFFLEAPSLAFIDTHVDRAPQDRALQSDTSISRSRLYELVLHPHLKTLLVL